MRTALFSMFVLGVATLMFADGLALGLIFLSLITAVLGAVYPIGYYTGEWKTIPEFWGSMW